MAKTPYIRRDQEEIINASLHAFGAGIFVFGTLLLIHIAADKSTYHIMSAAAFGISLFLTYVTSVLYHGTLNPGLKRKFRFLDHATIYLAIAGCNTPLFLLTVPKLVGIPMCIIVWVIAIAGIRYKYYNLGKHEKFSIVTYVIMGWLCLAVSPWWGGVLSIDALKLLIGGGVMYTIGAYFYYTDYTKYYHTIWHVTVLVGSIMHYVLMLKYIIPIDI